MMTATHTPRAELGGAVSIGNEREEDQDPLPDGEELPEDDEAAEKKREPESIPDEDAEG